MVCSGNVGLVINLYDEENNTLLEEAVGYVHDN